MFNDSVLFIAHPFHCRNELQFLPDIEWFKYVLASLLWSFKYRKENICILFRKKYQYWEQYKANVKIFLNLDNSDPLLDFTF